MEGGGGREIGSKEVEGGEGGERKANMSTSEQ